MAQAGQQAAWWCWGWWHGLCVRGCGWVGWVGFGTHKTSSSKTAGRGGGGGGGGGGAGAGGIGCAWGGWVGGWVGSREAKPSPSPSAGPSAMLLPAHLSSFLFRLPQCMHAPVPAHRHVHHHASEEEDGDEGLLVLVLLCPGPGGFTSFFLRSVAALPKASPVLQSFFFGSLPTHPNPHHLLMPPFPPHAATTHLPAFPPFGPSSPFFPLQSPMEIDPPPETSSSSSSSSFPLLNLNNACLPYAAAIASAPDFTLTQVNEGLQGVVDREEELDEGEEEEEGGGGWNEKGVGPHLKRLDSLVSLKLAFTGEELGVFIRLIYKLILSPRLSARSQVSK